MACFLPHCLILDKSLPDLDSPVCFRLPDVFTATCLDSRASECTSCEVGLGPLRRSAPHSLLCCPFPHLTLCVLPATVGAESPLGASLEGSRGLGLAASGPNPTWALGLGTRQAALAPAIRLDCFAATLLSQMRSLQAQQSDFQMCRRAGVQAACRPWVGRV